MPRESRWTLRYLCLGCRQWAEGSPPLSVQGALSFCGKVCHEVYRQRVRLNALERGVRARKRALPSILAAIQEARL